MKAARVVGLVLLAACSDITSPIRGDFYEWRLLVSAGGNAVDTLGFTWPSDRLPVRFWVQDTLGLPSRVDAAITTWEQQFLYGEFSGTRVSDQDDADVLVFGGTPIGSPVLESRAEECNGATDVDINQTTKVLTAPVRVFIASPFEEGDPAVDACLDLTTAHEVGHAIGLFRHSEDPSDLMYFNPTVAGPSDRDRATVQRAYHTPSTVTVTGAD